MRARACARANMRWNRNPRPGVPLTRAFAERDEEHSIQTHRNDPHAVQRLGRHAYSAYRGEKNERDGRSGRRIPSGTRRPERLFAHHPALPLSPKPRVRPPSDTLSRLSSAGSVCDAGTQAPKPYRIIGGPAGWNQRTHTHHRRHRCPRRHTASRHQTVRAGIRSSPINSHRMAQESTGKGQEPQGRQQIQMKPRTSGSSVPRYAGPLNRNV